MAMVDERMKDFDAKVGFLDGREEVEKITKRMLEQVVKVGDEGAQYKARSD